MTARQVMVGGVAVAAAAMLVTGCASTNKASAGAQAQLTVAPAVALQRTMLNLEQLRSTDFTLNVQADGLQLNKLAGMPRQLGSLAGTQAQNIALSVTGSVAGLNSGTAEAARNTTLDAKVEVGGQGPVASMVGGFLGGQAAEVRVVGQHAYANITHTIDGKHWLDLPFSSAGAGLDRMLSPRGMAGIGPATGADKPGAPGQAGKHAPLAERGQAGRGPLANWHGGNGEHAKPTAADLLGAAQEIVDGTAMHVVDTNNDLVHFAGTISAATERAGAAAATKAGRTAEARDLNQAADEMSARDAGTATYDLWITPDFQLSRIQFSGSGVEGGKLSQGSVDLKLSNLNQPVTVTAPSPSDTYTPAELKQNFSGILGSSANGSSVIGGLG